MSGADVIVGGAAQGRDVHQRGRDRAESNDAACWAQFANLVLSTLCDVPGRRQELRARTIGVSLVRALLAAVAEARKCQPRALLRRSPAPGRSLPTLTGSAANSTASSARPRVVRSLTRPTAGEGMPAAVGAAPPNDPPPTVAHQSCEGAK